MSTQAEGPNQEIKLLQRCIRDLVSLLALPAVWTGNEPSRIIEILIDALLRMLRLDFVYARLEEPANATPVEFIRVSDSSTIGLQSHDVQSMLHRQFGAGIRNSPRPARRRFGGADVSFIPLLLGINGELGAIVVGSERAEFPEQTESLLLTVAANQASFALQEARLRGEQRKISSELDQRVAQRTSELAAANEELHEKIAERRQAEEALRGSEKSLRLILDGIAGLVAIMGATGEIESVNRQVLDYFGKSVDEMKGWSTSNSVHPDDLPGVLSAWKYSIETQSTYDIDHRLRRADGVYRWFHARGLPLLDPDGQVVRWYVLLTDIDDRTRAEEALRTSEANLRRVIDTIPTLSWCNMPDGSNEFLSKSWHDYTGLSPEEAHGWGWSAAFQPDDLPPLMERWQELLTLGEPGEIEARLKRHDGIYRWFLIRVQPFRDDEGRIVRWYGTSTDIEDRKMAEEALARSEAFLAEGQRLSRTGSFSWCVPSGEILWSEEMYRVFQFEHAATLTLDRIGSRIHREDLQLLRGMIDVARQGVSDFEYELRLPMPDNSIKYLHLLAHGRRDAGGRLEYIGAVQDVTRRRSSEEALAKARAELTNVARATSIGVLTASIAHEVNQPLSGIVTNASTCLRMLSANPPNIDGALETARRTIRDGNRASDVITRLRTLYSKKEPSLEAMDLNEATREVAALSLGELQQNGVALRYELAADLPPVVGDRVQIQQVILNLLRNAAEAMNSIDDRPRELFIQSERYQENQAMLSVKDSGVGFAPDSVDRLFEPFYTTKSDGMGIGLSISRSIIEAHQGRLWAKANDGPGTTLSFVIPCALKCPALAGAQSHPV